MLVLFLAAHILAALFWVGGMAFAYTMLRPAAGALEGPARLTLWRDVFARFLPWVGVSIVVLLVSGYAMMFMAYGGFRAPLSIHVMQGTGILMMLLYLHLYFAPWRRLQKFVRAADWPNAGKQLAMIRKLVAINLVLGVITVLVGSTGRLW
ncbi:CopD family protein [Pseudorhodoplanes sp.]|uniref:CopD family protein n=1 Tax=Pseudorhodoplanes sp. TaxID=1934341 RepID=UPI003D0AB927